MEWASSPPAGKTWEIFLTFWEEANLPIFWPLWDWWVPLFIYRVFAFDLQRVPVTQPKQRQGNKTNRLRTKQKTLIISRYDHANGNTALCSYGDILQGTSRVLHTLHSHLSHVITHMCFACYNTVSIRHPLCVSPKPLLHFHLGVRRDRQCEHRAGKGAQESLGSPSVGTGSSLGWRRPGRISAWHIGAPQYMVIGRINEWRRSILVARDTNRQSIPIINSTLQMERLSYGEINWFKQAQPASYLMSGTRPDFMFPGSEPKVFALDLCTCWPVPADGHFDKSSQLEADVIMVYTETRLPEVPNSEVALLRFPVCVWVCVCITLTNKQISSPSQRQQSSKRRK